MANERETPRLPELERPETPPAEKERGRKIAETPEEVTPDDRAHVFRDWALI